MSVEEWWVSVMVVGHQDDRRSVSDDRVLGEHVNMTPLHTLTYLPPFPLL